VLHQTRIESSLISELSASLASICPFEPLLDTFQCISEAAPEDQEPDCQAGKGPNYLQHLGALQVAVTLLDPIEDHSDIMRKDTLEMVVKIIVTKTANLTRSENEFLLRKLNHFLLALSTSLIQLLMQHVKLGDG